MPRQLDFLPLASLLPTPLLFLPPPLLVYFLTVIELLRLDWTGSMGMPLKEALRRLCVEIGWSYAVFWKAIGFSHHIHLVWEDSCYSEKQFAGTTVPLDLLLKEQGVVHAIGEGIVGQTAMSGMHLWVNRDAPLSDRIKDFTELNRQFSAGIQTIVAIPVLPHGVLQLGSTCTVMENIPFLVLVKSLFSQLQSGPIASLAGSSQTTQIHSHSPANKVDSPNSCTPTVQSNSLECNISNVPKEETSQQGSDLFEMFGASNINEPGPSFGNIGEDRTDNMQNFDLLGGHASQSGIFSDSGTDQLLDAVVSNINTHAKENTISSGMGAGNLSSDTMLTNTQASSSHSSQKSQLQLWIEGGSASKSDGLQSGAVGTSSADMALRSTNKKRCRPGESPRPRPKDRQLIQDRIKELRELVPNGAKCSIDALLEKTIKHMLFLQSVKKHASKLKESGRSKEQQLVSEEGGVLLKDDFEGGATWAFEVGPQSMSCPIVVEDLDPPRQLLIEMVCEDRGLFLEIADLVKGLGLTILKGVMEARKNKIWARFAVEATRDVTRMDIFLSLVHLLNPNVNSNDNEAPSGTIGNNNNAPNQTGVVIPTTGVPDGLR